MDVNQTTADNSAESSAIRATLRRQCLAARIALAQAPEEHAKRSASIQHHLFAWFSEQPPTSFSFCAAVRGEFDCEPLAINLISLGWRGAMAVAATPAAPLDFRLWDPGVAMQTDHHGIPVPQSALVPAPQVLLIPLVAYDDNGFRLGYGGGYFDRTLAGLANGMQRPTAIGVGFTVSKVVSVLPQPHDQRMDIIVTEAGLQTMPPLLR